MIDLLARSLFSRSNHSSVGRNDHRDNGPTIDRYEIALKLSQLRADASDTRLQEVDCTFGAPDAIYPANAQQLA